MSNVGEEPATQVQFLHVLLSRVCRLIKVSDRVSRLRLVHQILFHYQLMRCKNCHFIIM